MGMGRGGGGQDETPLVPPPLHPLPPRGGAIFFGSCLFNYGLFSKKVLPHSHELIFLPPNPEHKKPCLEALPRVIKAYQSRERRYWEMAVIVPFRGISYNLQKIYDLSKVVAPPYDVISPQEQDVLYQPLE